MTNTNQFGIDTSTLGDQSKEERGGGGFTSLLKEPTAAGVAMIRFVSYIQKGTHTSKAGKTACMHALEFEVVSPRHVKHVDAKDDKAAFSITETIIVNLREGYNSKSAFFNFFKGMNYDNKYTNFAQMLGQGFLCDIMHSMDDSGTKVMYANIHDGMAGKYTVRAPTIIDPLTNKATIVEIPEASKPLRMFLWDTPTQQMWDSINISDKEDSDPKNFFKKDIQAAEDFAGSPVQAFLAGGLPNDPLAGV